MIDEISIPFYCDNVYSGFAQTQGLISTDSNHIVIEFETKDAIIKLLSSGIKSVKIPYDALLSIELKKKFFSYYIVITTKSMKYVANIPGNENNIFSCQIKKQNIDLAKLLISQVQLQLAEIKLSKYEK